MSVEDVLIVGMSKKIVVAQQKHQKAIVNEARKQAIIKKANGQKPFFCDMLLFQEALTCTLQHLGQYVVWVL